MASCTKPGEPAPDPTPGPSTAPSTPSTPSLPTTTAPAPAPGQPAVARAAPPGSGPRPLPPTFVPLELAEFPRPADEKCADGPELRVESGSSLGDALAEAAPGTTVVVEPGTYPGAADDDAALRIGTDDLCLRAADGGTAVLEPAGSFQTTGIVLTGSGTVVEGFTLRGFAAGIVVGRGEGDTQQDVTIQRVVVEEMTGDFHDGIVAVADNREEPGAPPTIDGLLLQDVHVDGTDLGISCNAGPCAHWWVEDSTVRGRRGAGSSGADAFAVEEGRQIAIVDSTFENADADGIDTKADDVVVYGAQVRTVGRNGIKAWRGVDVITSLVDGTGADASLVGARAGRYRYLGSLVAHHGEPGGRAYVAGWSYDEREPGVVIEIVNCIFFENVPGGMFAPADASLTIEDTVLATTADDKLIDLGDERTYAVSELAEFLAAGYGSDVIVGDPRFVDPSGNDFSTRPDSPARDAGASVAGVDRDLWGNPRSAGGGPDIGPVESGDGTP